MAKIAYFAKLDELSKLSGVVSHMEEIKGVEGG